MGIIPWVNQLTVCHGKIHGKKFIGQSTMNQWTIFNSHVKSALTVGAEAFFVRLREQ
jgi:hypothetical protein